MEGTETGKFTDTAQTVKYVYTKDQEGQSKPEEKGSEENALPHTGTKNSPLLAALGAAILGIGALMFPFKKKGKHRKH
ncbi:hypothetical protein M222_2836 [Enterococcus faecalis AZ19]|nr:hypothetical protein M222_2836 [Enterococcus faecalis AZ19]